MSPKKRGILPLHPFLLSATSVISLLALNKTEVHLQAAARPLVLVLLITLICYFAIKFILRSPHKAGLLTSILVFLFVSYNQVFSLLKNAGTLTFLAHHRYLILVYLLILAIAVFFVARRKISPKITWALNLIMVFALAIPSLQLIHHYSTSSVPDQNKSNPITVTGETLAKTDKGTPDIYYIILDSYTRDDQLYNDYGYDNSIFIDELRSRGFYVADCSRSNYAHTKLSLGSSLNLDYLQNLGVNLDESTGEVVSFTDLIVHNKVRELLTELGYKTVAFETGYIFTEITDAEVYYTSPDNTILSPYIEPFEYLYLQNSIVRVLFDTESHFADRFIAPLVFPFTSQEMRVKNVFSTLPQVPEIAGPKFVFVHLDIPHHPFIFLPDGSINPDHNFYPGVNMPEDLATMKEGYINQVEYVNAAILPIVDEILSKSSQPPIIILQGDHGLMVGERNDILNAIYLPDGGTERLYSNISPVNTFRLIFAEYFNADYPLLEDTAYYSKYEDKLNLILSEDKSDRCGAN